jgi:hypothetical protein
MRRRVRSNDDLLRELAKEMLWSLLTLFSVLTYFSEIRPFILLNFGLYGSGLLDGATMAITSIIVIFFLVSESQEKSEIHKTYS